MRVFDLLPIFSILLFTFHVKAQRIEQEGLTFDFSPRYSLAEKQSVTGGYYPIVTVHALNARVVHTQGINYRGKNYKYNDFDGQLQSYFDAIQVLSLYIVVEIEGTNCSHTPRIEGLFKNGDQKGNALCLRSANAATFLSVLNFDVKKIGETTGVKALRDRIDALEAELKKKQQLQQQLDQLIRQAEIHLNNGNVELAEEGIKKAKELSGNSNEKTREIQLIERRISENKNITKKEEPKEKSETAPVQKESQPEKQPEVITEVNSNIFLAQAYEREGDRLNAMGSFNALKAYEQYQQAQKIYYTERVQTKMNAINGEIQLAQGLNQLGSILGDELDKLTNDFDPEGKTSWSHLGLGYVGGLGAIGKGDMSIPQSTYFTMAMHFLGISLEGRAAHNVLPIRTYNIYRTGWNQVIQQGYYHPVTGLPVFEEATATVKSSAWSLGYSIGLNLPLKYFHFYGIYGVDYMLGEKYEVDAIDFVYDGANYPGPSSNKQKRYTAGINFQIPGSSVGLGLSYNIYSVAGGITLDGIIYEMKYVGSNTDLSRGINSSSYYHLYKDKFDKYVHRNLGFHLFYRFRAR